MLLRLVVEGFAVLLAVDFVSGLVHWAEDTFGTVDTPIVGRWIIAPNVLHHDDALAFVGKSWLASSWDLTLASAVTVLVSLAIGAFHWTVLLFAFAAANANEIHKWNHLGRRAPIIARALWWTRLLQRPKHHAEHHRGAKNTRYCVVTPLVNPILDGVRFWRGLERCLVPILGAPRREDLRALRSWRETRSARVRS